MSYVDELAHAIQRELPPDLVPGGDTGSLFRLYALLALSRGSEVSREDVHDAWSAWMSDRDPGHPALRPFAELDAKTQQADQPYVDAIRKVAASRHQAVPAS
jgi:hypothetical protein